MEIVRRRGDFFRRNNEQESICISDCFSGHHDGHGAAFDGYVSSVAAGTGEGFRYFHFHDPDDFDDDHDRYGPGIGHGGTGE